MENLVRIWHLALFCSFESPTLQEQSKQMYAPMLINPFGKISKESLLGLETFEEREISCQPDAEIYLVPPRGLNLQRPPRLPFLLGVWRAALPRLKKGIWGPRGQPNLRKIQMKHYLTMEVVTASKNTSVSQITENGKAMEQNHSLFSAVSWLHSLAWHLFPLMFLIL